MEMEEIFERYNDDYLKFERVEHKRSDRPDLHAFLLLDELFPGNRDMISYAEHDEFYLDINDDDIQKLTEKQVLELIRCGVMYNGEGLWMFS